jgi:hypothetical protein
MAKNVRLYEIIFLYAFNQLEILVGGKGEQPLDGAGMWKAGA